MKKLLKLLLILVFLVNEIGFDACAQKSSDVAVSSYCCKLSDCYKLSDLVDSFKDYITTNVEFHAGDLYQHSIWAAVAINRWLEMRELSCGSLIKDLSLRDRKLATHAALLHDVGKAGDLDYTFYTKPGHEVKGLKYLTSQKSFYLAQNKTFDFVKFFNSIELSPEEVKEISIIVGCHNLLGKLLTKLPKKIDASSDLSGFNAEINNFFLKIKDMFGMVGYKKPLSLRLLRLIILVCLADVKASSSVYLDKPIKVFGFIIKSSPDATHPSGSDNFAKFGYDSRGLKVCERLLLFEDKK